MEQKKFLCHEVLSVRKLTGCFEMEDVRLLLLPCQGEGGLSEGIVVSYCMIGDFLYDFKWLFTGAMVDQLFSIGVKHGA